MDPFTIALIMAAVTAVAAGGQAYVAHEQQEFQEKVAKRNAVEADASRRMEMNKRARDARRRNAAARAKFSAAGVATQGSVVEVLGDTSREEAYALGAANRNWVQTINQHKVRASAASQAQQGAIIGGALSVGGAAATGFAQGQSLNTGSTKAPVSKRQTILGT